MNKIDERTSVPISWLAVLIAAVLGPTVAGSMWIKGVDDRLSRIEAVLHIQAQTESHLIETAHADGER